jgi:hypothetical protein
MQLDQVKKDPRPAFGSAVSHLTKAVGAEQGEVVAYKLNYDRMVLLDAEDLAETGLKEAYESLLPELARHVPNPIALEEHIDSDAPRYSVAAGGAEYVVYAPELNDSEGRSWDRATWALFSIINKQLENTAVRFYAINGGNDLGGMFLTAQQVEDAKKSLKRRSDWPYIPKNEHPWYGQEH